MTKFFNNSINLIFGLIHLLLQFGQNKFFQKITHSFTSVSTSLPKFRENWWSNSKKKPAQREWLADPISENQSGYCWGSNLISSIGLSVHQKLVWLVIWLWHYPGKQSVWEYKVYRCKDWILVLWGQSFYFA